jgi:hypothetical protein
VGSGTGPIHDVTDVRAEPDGAVGVQVGDLGSMDGSTVTPLAQRQWRAYSWNGTRFTQTGGPTSFPPNPNRTDLAVSASDLHLGPVTGGARHGTLTVTVTNKGPGAPAVVRLDVFTGDSLNVTAPPGVTCTRAPNSPVNFEDNICQLAGPAAGKSVTVALQYTTTGSVVFSGPQPPGKVTLDAQTSTGVPTLDTNGSNNQAEFQVTVSD